MNKNAENTKILFDPQSVAVIGASDNPGKLGFHVMKSLTEGGFSGRVIPVNPGAPLLDGPGFPGRPDPAWRPATFARPGGSRLSVLPRRRDKKSMNIRRPLP